VTLANKLTLARLAAAPLAFLCIWLQRPSLYLAALVLYVLAISTDWVDGYIARKTKSVSPFGAAADPLADKVLVIGALLAFLRIPELDVPNWAVFLIIVRELLIGGLRALAGSQGVLLFADKGGKLKMVVQSATVLVILILLVLRHYFMTELPGWTERLPYYFVVASMGISILSGAMYVHTSRRMLKKSWNTPQKKT